MRWAEWQSSKAVRKLRIGIPLRASASYFPKIKYPPQALSPRSAQAETAQALPRSLRITAQAMTRCGELYAGILNEMSCVMMEDANPCVDQIALHERGSLLVCRCPERTPAADTGALSPKAVTGRLQTFLGRSSTFCNTNCLWASRPLTISERTTLRHNLAVQGMRYEVGLSFSLPGASVVLACVLDSPGRADHAPPTAGATVDFLAAIRNGDTTAVKAHLRRGTDANARDEDAATALMHAAADADLTAMKLLLEAGANVNAASKGGATALLWRYTMSRRSGFF